jgi:hypothetical protein
MTPRGLTPEVEERIVQLAEADTSADDLSIDHVVAAFMAGARDSETRELARQVLAEHREFFDLVGDR